MTSCYISLRATFSSETCSNYLTRILILLSHPPRSFVEEYSAHVRQHPQVKFAVDCALAFDSNNFVKFFKLLRCIVVTVIYCPYLTGVFFLCRSASFLCACAVHRFFNMVC